MADRLEEAIRVVLETQGAEGLDQLRDALSGLGDASADTVADTNKLLDSLTELNSTAAKATRYGDMLDELSRLEEEFNRNQKAAYQLSLQLSSTEKPSRELLKTQKDLRSEGERLRDVLVKQWAALEQSDAELTSLGLNTSDLATAQKKLRDAISKGAAAIGEQAEAVQDQADANRILKEELAEGDRRFKEQADSSRAAAESLDAYRARAAAAAEQTDGLKDSASATEGVLRKLKVMAAGVLSYLSFRSVLAGIRSIVTEGSNAEQELGQLEAALESTGRRAEFTAQQLADMADGLNKGLFSDGDITSATTRLLTYTNIVGAQFPRAMQIAIDQAARLGIGIEESAEKIGTALQTPSKAMQTLSRQGFVIEESQKRVIQSLEATGRMAEAQAIIMDMLVESYAGAAAAKNTNKILGLWERLRETWRGWQTEVANRGVLDYFKSQLTDLLATTERLAKDGTLGRWAQQTADLIVKFSETVKGATVWLVEHRNALLLAAKTYAAFKIGAALIQLNLWRVKLIAATKEQLKNLAAMEAAGKGAIGFGNILRSIPTSIKIGIALVGVDLAIKGAKELGEWLGKNSEAAEQLALAQEEMRDKLHGMAADYRDQAAALEAYAHVVTLSAEQVYALGEAERQAYEARLKGLREYLLKLNAYYIAMQEAGSLTEVHAAQWKVVQDRLAGVNRAYQDLAEGVRIAAEALRTGVTPAAQKVIEQLGDIAGDAQLAESQIRKLFDGLNFADVNTLGDVALALASIADQGAGADRNIRDGLLRTLQQLSGEELARFQMGAQAAFDELKKSPAEIAAILDTTLLAGMEKLGVAAERMGMKFSVAGRDAVAVFGSILENANATSAQIETAFKAAVSKVATLEEARALGVLLQSAGEQGKLGFDAAARAGAALEARIKGITIALDPLTDEFGKLGIQSQTSLNAARDAAWSAFEAIRKGAAQGKASIEDVRRAYQSYARTARDAVADSDDSARARVENELAVLDAIHTVNKGLQDMGEEGRTAGAGVAEGAREGAEALQDTASAATDAAEGISQVAGATGGVQSGSIAAAEAVFTLGSAFGELSDKARMAYMSANEALSPLTGSNGLFDERINDVTARIREQKTALEQHAEALQQSLGEMDEFADRRKELSAQYQYLGESQIDRLLQLERQLDQAQKQRAERVAKENERSGRDADKQLEAARALEQTVPDPGIREEKLTIEWKAPSKSTATSASVAETEQAERLANLVLPILIRKLQRSRELSNARGLTRR